MKLEGKVAIVAGGGQGIGEGCVKCLAEEGADVAVIDINGETARKMADEVKSMGRKALAIETDATDISQVNKAVQDTLDFFGKIDILVNNVGGFDRRSFERAFALGDELDSHMFDMMALATEEEWDRSYNINLKAHLLMSRAVVSHMIKQKSGKIVNISSQAGKDPDPGNMPYGTFKGAVVTFTYALARLLARHNINVNCILPGLIYTPLWEKYATLLSRAYPEMKDMPPRELFLKTQVSRVPLGREQTVEDIGRAVVFFASDDAANITGQSLMVNGGQVMH